MKTIMETVQKPQRPVKVLQFGEGNFLRAFYSRLPTAWER